MEEAVRPWVMVDFRWGVSCYDWVVELGLRCVACSSSCSWILSGKTGWGILNEIGNQFAGEL